MTRYEATQPAGIARIAYTMDTAYVPAYALLMERAGARLFYELGGEPLEVDTHRDVDAIPAGHPFTLVVSANVMEELIEWADTHTQDEDLYGNLLDIWVDVQRVVYR